MRTIAVIKFREGWHLVPGGSTPQYFPCRADAVRGALGLVQVARAAGHDVELLVHEEFGELRRVDVDRVLLQRRPATASSSPRLHELRESASAGKRLDPARPSRAGPCEAPAA